MENLLLYTKMDQDQSLRVLINSKQICRPGKRASLFPHIDGENRLFTFLVSELLTITQVYTCTAC